MRHTLIRGCLAAAVLIAAAEPAHAQGGILGRVADKAKGAVAKKGDAEKPADAAPAARSSRRGPAPAFNDEVLEITEGRIAQLIAGLDAEAAARPALEREHAAGMARYEAAREAFPAKIEAYERARAAWRERDKKYEACVDGLNEKWEAEDAKSPDRVQMEKNAASVDNPEFKARLEARMKDISARMQAAQARGDQKTMMALSDTMQREMAPLTAMGRQGVGVAQRAEAQAKVRLEEQKRTCGEDPERSEPESPESPNSLLPKGVYEGLEEAGAKGAKLSRRQYAVLKERVGAYLALKKHGDGVSSLYAYGDGERAALDKELPGLARRPEVLDF